MKKLLFCILFASCAYNLSAQKITKEEKAAKNVLTRIMGEKKANLFSLQYVKDESSNYKYTVKTEKGKIAVTGNSPVALSRGAYDYLRNACNSIISWSGNNISIPAKLPEYNTAVTSPYKYHYYFNVVTHGYTMPYWDFQRWEKELDWMAVHGIDMPLMSGAYEAILYRVFEKLGLTESEINSFFTGPAYFPWNRMGNITGWGGPLPKTFFSKQIELFHKVYNRSKELGMHPIIPAFAGFVPEGVKRLYPDEKLRELKWGGFDKKFNAHILAPGSDLFEKIGQQYIVEWEKEFGKGEFYLADSFNEMAVPLSADKEEALKELAGFGESVYKSIRSANPDAVWVMQGWTFPYQREAKGKLFWTPERLAALISKVPDDKLMILDMANEYNLLSWKLDPSWKMYPGFFGKKWIYSFIPNMGGTTPLNGCIDVYSTIPIEALQYENKKNLVGFGFAPEGIENNEIVFELLADMGWRDKQIELTDWISHYCTSRYGSYPDDLKTAYSFLTKSCFSGFSVQPQFQYQLSPKAKGGASVNKSENYGRGVEAFLKSRDKFKNNNLYKYDAIELAAQYLGLKVDEKLELFKADTAAKNYKLLDEALDMLSDIDRLLESHPNYRLSKWIDFARKFGNSKDEKQYYETDAKRIITSWGGTMNKFEIDDYAAKMWSGLIRDYYIPRIKHYFYGQKEKNGFDVEQWQEEWIKKPGVSSVKPFADPIEKASELFHKYYKGL